MTIERSSERVSQRAIDLELELKLELASEAWQLHKLPRGLQRSAAT